MQSRFDRLTKPKLFTGLRHQPVHNYLNIVDLVTVDLHFGLYFLNFPVYTRFIITHFPDLLTQFPIVSFSAFHYWSQYN